MDGDAGAGVMAEEGVVVVLAVAGLALVPTLEPAREEVTAVVPAARALEQVAADGGHVAQLRRGGLGSGLGERGVTLPDNVAGLDIGQGDAGAEREPLRRLFDAVRQLRESLEVDQLLWRSDIRLEQGEQVGAAGEGADGRFAVRRGSVLAEEGEGFVD